MVDRLRELGAEHIKVFGGGGGTITPDEIRELMEYGVERIYHPHDGMELGLQAMIEDLVARTQSKRRPTTCPSSERTRRHRGDDFVDRRRCFDEARTRSLRKEWQVKAGQVPVVGITGTGGAGKSSVTDEILNRLLASFPDKRIAVLAVDPTRGARAARCWAIAFA